MSLFPLLLLLLLLLPAAALQHNHPFTTPETPLTNGTASIKAHAASILPDNSLLLLTTITAPANYTNNLITHDPSAPPFPATSLLLIRLHNATHPIWALRAHAVPPTARFALTLHDQFIYVAGEAAHRIGMLLVKFTITGVTLASVIHGLPTSAYHSIHVHHNLPNALLLTCSAPPTAPPFNSSPFPPETSGLCIAKVQMYSLRLIHIMPITHRNTTSSAKLIRDSFWSAHLSPNGRTLFVATRRQTALQWIHSFTPVLHAMRVDIMVPALTPRALPRHLQNEMTIRATNDDLYAAYVARIDNEERLTVARFTHDLQPSFWNDQHTFSHHIVQDASFTRLVKTNVRDLHLDPHGNINILLYAAELLDRDNDLEHRALSNGRPAIIVLTNTPAISQISQAGTAEQWRPQSLIVGKHNFYIFGENLATFGSHLHNYPSMLLTSVHRDPIPTPPPPLLAPPIEKSDESASCIAATSVVNGRRVRDAIRGRGLRLQRHPLRVLAGIGKDKVRMLCVSRGDSSICATRFHVVRVFGIVMYMWEFCSRASVSCREGWEMPVGFKGRCGRDLEVWDGFSVTMHAGRGDVPAEDVVRRECALQATWWLAWFVSSL